MLKSSKSRKKTTKQKGSEKTWTQIENLIIKLGQKYHPTKKVIYTKSRGGLVPARLLADKFHCTKIIVDPKTVPPNSIFVDDIYDTGKTFREISKIAKGKFTFVTLYHRKGSSIPSNIIYAEETRGKEYIVFPWDKIEYFSAKKT